MADAGQDLLQEVFRLVLEEREAARARDQVVEFREPAELKERLPLEIPEEGVSNEELLDAMRRYLDCSVDTSHPRFLNQLWAGFNPAGFAGEALTALRNTSMYTYEVAPAATLIEEALIRKMASLVGYPEGEGTFTTGGSNSNLLAMLLARNAAAERVKWEGCGEAAPLIAFVSDQAHYSFDQAAHVLGIGISRVRKVATDEYGRMLPDRLAAAVAESKEQGEIPFFVGATGGTTVLGAYDPLPPLADIAEEHGLWLHVDGSWGGSVILSRRWRHLLEGCERSHSFGWTAHKMMGVPLVCSTLLVREPGVLGRSLALSDSSGDYLFHGGEEGSCDLGHLSLQCGRRADALKLWLSWLAFGDRGYEERIDRMFELVAHVTERIREADDFELAAPVGSMNVCFRYLPGKGRDPDRINVELRERLRRTGHSMVNYGTVDGRKAIRLVIPNPEITPRDLDELLEGIRTVAQTAHSEPVG